MYSDSPPQDQGGWGQETTLSLVLESVNIVDGYGLVRGSASWQEAGTCWTRSDLDTTFSLTKWISNSMCFVRAWRIGLCASKTTLRLSQSSIGVWYWTWSSVNRDSCQRSSEVVCAMLLYSASVLDLATKGYFLELQDTRFGPTKMHVPDVERLSSGSLPSQSHYRRKGTIYHQMWLVAAVNQIE